MLSPYRILLPLVGIMVALGISGCETIGFGDRVWYKPGGTIEERDRLLAAAQVQGVQAESAFPNGGVDRAQTERHTVLTYMTAAGWNLVPKNEAGSLDNVTKVKSSPRSATASTAMDR